MASREEQHRQVVRELKEAVPGDVVLTDEGVESVAAFIAEFAAERHTHDVAADILSAVKDECAYEPHGAVMGVVYKLPQQFNQKARDAWLILDAREVVHSAPARRRVR